MGHQPLLLDINSMIWAATLELVTVLVLTTYKPSMLDDGRK